MHHYLFRMIFKFCCVCVLKWFASLICFIFIAVALFIIFLFFFFFFFECAFSFLFYRVDIKLNRNLLPKRLLRQLSLPIVVNAMRTMLKRSQQTNKQTMHRINSRIRYNAHLYKSNQRPNMWVCCAASKSNHMACDMRCDCFGSFSFWLCVCVISKMKIIWIILIDPSIDRLINRHEPNKSPLSSFVNLCLRVVLLWFFTFANHIF